MRTLVLVSGRGSNLRALVEARDAGHCDIELSGVLSDRAEAAALDYARDRGIPTRVVPMRDYPSREAWDEALSDAAATFAPRLIVLAGFMRVLGAAMVERFAGRIINVHPSLLPAFPGKDGPAMALAAGVAITGCTVHVVDRGVDSGPILAQAAVAVRRDDDRDRLHARIQREEHVLLPRVVHAIARGALELGTQPRFVAREAEVEPASLHWPALQE